MNSNKEKACMHIINSKLSDMLSNGYNPADAINEVSKEYGLTKEIIIKNYREEFEINPLKWTEDDCI